MTKILFIVVIVGSGWILFTVLEGLEIWTTITSRHLDPQNLASKTAEKLHRHLDEGN